MIVVYPERLIPSSINVITLQDNRKYYYYVYLDVYNQALLLKNQYRDNLKALKLQTGFSHDYEAVDYLFEILPEPINYLVVLLNLLEYSPDANEITYCCGALSMILDTISVMKYLSVPFEIRKEITFSIRIQEEYEIKLNRFMEQAIPYSKFFDISTQSEIKMVNQNKSSQQISNFNKSLEKSIATSISPVNIEVDPNGGLIVPEELNGVTVEIQDEDDTFFDDFFKKLDKKEEEFDESKKETKAIPIKGSVQKQDKQAIDGMFDEISSMTL